MWWGRPSHPSAPSVPRKPTGRCVAYDFNVEQELGDLDRRIELLSAMQEPVAKVQAPRQLSLKSPPVLAALPPPVSDIIERINDTIPLRPREEEKYWSTDAEFWTKWKTDERLSRQTVLNLAKSALETAKNEAALAAAAAEEAERIRKEKEVSEQEEAQKASVKPVEPPTPQQPSVSSTLSTDYDNIMALGKQFRPQFMDTWKEISVGVSATACNARSIQLNCTRVGGALRNAASQCANTRPQVITWLSAFCGSKIVAQACSGNKSLVWSFCYFARTIADLFPDTIRVGVMGEMAKSAPSCLIGLPGMKQVKPLEGTPKDFEIHTRFLVALMITCQDETSLWAWIADAINRLRSVTTQQSSTSLWNLMKVFIWMDIGLYDFRRLFATQANMLLGVLEQTVFPQIDAELQRITTTGGSTNISVQIRFYLDSCYNIIQSRKYLQPPEGRMLAAAKESELNPEL